MLKILKMIMSFLDLILVLEKEKKKRNHNPNQRKFSTVYFDNLSPLEANKQTEFL